jgi:hypothetical protein
VDHCLKQGPVAFGDLILVDAFGTYDVEKLEILIKLIFSSPGNKFEELKTTLGGSIPLLVNMSSLAKLSPDVLCRVLPSLFFETSLSPDYLAACVVPLIAPHWVHPQWVAILQGRLQFYQENLVEHCINFLKKNNESEALVHWTSDRQFCNSLASKIVALLREMELNYPLEGSQPIKNRQTALEFRWELECCILFALLSEVENHLKNFMLASTSKFILDTIKAYLLPDTALEYSEESHESEIEVEEESEDMDKMNKILKSLIGQLDSNSKLNIFAFCYHIHRKVWSIWSSFDRKDLLQFENREVNNRANEPSLTGQPSKQRTPKIKGISALSGRQSFQSMSQVSINKRRNTVAILEDTFKAEYWTLVLSRYGILP